MLYLLELNIGFRIILVHDQLNQLPFKEEAFSWNHLGANNVFLLTVQDVMQLVTAATKALERQ